MKKLCLLILLLAPSVLAWAQNGKTQSIEVKGDYFQMVYVQGGSFMMGAPTSGQKAEADAKPAHKVTVSSFYIGEYEVTQRDWELVMGDNPSSYQSNYPSNIFINVPVTDVSWSDCQVFIEKLNALTGCRFRLPTEAEWEFAARGGIESKGYMFAGGDIYGNLAARRNWEQCSYIGPSTSRFGNELGLYDMTGNVEEWCQDWYGPYGNSAQVNPKGPNSGSERVLRGGSFYLGDPQRRVWDRAHASGSLRSTHIGLRLACDVSGLKVKEEPAEQEPPKPVLPNVFRLDLDKGNLKLKLGEEASLKVTVSPRNADQSTIKWASSNASVATVSQFGKVTGVANGTATITVSADNRVEAKCEVMVFSYLTPKQVDLGLSVKWGSFNLGASEPEGYGRYYAWGETEHKKDYSWDAYKWCRYSAWELTKYCPNSGYGLDGFSDDKTVLDPEDDAAHVALGGKWRIPTEAEYQELLAKCKQEWVRVNGVFGVKFTSKINGNSVFFPAAGHITERDGLTGDETGGLYSSSSVLREGGIHKEYCLSLDGRSARDGSALRRDGCPIRPVYGDPKPSAGTAGKAEGSLTSNASGMVDLGLSVKWASCNVGAKAPEEFGNYYAWGETAPKSAFGWGTYKWSGLSAQSLKKYCGVNGFGENGYLDDKTELDPEDDVASVVLGAGWRMPTEQEIKELEDNCSWEWTELNKVPGFKVTSLKNGNSIFLPAAGRIQSRGEAEVRISVYSWSKSLSKAYPNRPDLAGSISRSNRTDAVVPYRNMGCTVRAVYVQ